MNIKEEGVCRRLPLEKTQAAIESAADGNLTPLICNYDVPRHEALAILQRAWQGMPIHQAVATYLDRIGIPESNNVRPASTTES
jgi:hypothetical protein